MKHATQQSMCWESVYAAVKIMPHHLHFVSA